MMGERMRLVPMKKGNLSLAALFFLLSGLALAQAPQAVDRDQITTMELERSSPAPKMWPLPIEGRVPIVETVGDKIGQTVGTFPFKRRRAGDDSFPSPVSSLHSRQVYSLQDCLEISIKNNENLKIARKQIELALAKLDEAKRALFPNATFRSSLTQGETRTAPFKEREFIFRIEQPLLDGGGLKATLAQAQVNLEVARTNYDKVMQDLRFEVEKNYYELAKLLLQLDVQQEIMDQAEPMVELAKRELEVDVITRLEYLNVQTLFNQFLYQYKSTEKDVSLARMNLQHSMNLPTDVPILIDYLLEFLEFGKGLEECQELARKRRPEVLMNYLLVKFHGYSQKIIEAKKHWKLDLATSYGSSGSAFKGESLSLGDDLFFGVQLSRPFGLHSLTSSMTNQKTAAKLGQSDRTESTAASTELGLFNQYGGVSEEKEAEVSYRQAVGEWHKVQKTVESEVSEAYFNGQKAAILYNAQKERVEFRKKGLVVVELQQHINEALISNVLEAQLQLAQERIALVSALADYHLSLANLNRTTGYAL